MAKINVLHLVHWPRSGISKQVATLIRSLDGEAVQSSLVFLVDDPEVGELRRTVGNVLAVPLAQGRWGALRKLSSLVEMLQPDILHSHTLTPLLICSLLSRRRKHFTTIHGDYPFLARDFACSPKRTVLTGSLKRYCDLAVCVSEKVAEHVRLLGISTGKVEVIENGLAVRDISRYLERTAEVRRGLQVRLDDFLFITVGRLSPEKGFAALLESFAAAFRDREDVRLVVVGEGAERARLVSRLQELNCCHKVRLAGYRNDPYEYLCASDAYVCSSLYEGFGLSIVEAMNCKLPVVSTNVGVMQDPAFLRAGNLVVNGVGEMEQALRLCCQQRGALREIGERNFAMASARFSARCMAEQYLKKYRTALDDRA